MTTREDSRKPLRLRERAAAMTLAQIDTVLESDAHYAATPTRNYGDADPLVNAAQQVFDCKCGSPACLVLDKPPAKALAGMRNAKVMDDGRTYFVKCTRPECESVGQPSLRDWRAVIDWNFMRGRATLEDVPYFNMRGMSPAQAQKHIEAIRWDLALRLAKADKERAAGLDVGGLYIARLNAWFGWAGVAQQVAKACAQAQSSVEQDAPRERPRMTA